MPPNASTTAAARRPTSLASGRAQARFAGSWRAGALLAALCAVLYAPGLFSLPPVDRDESRFAQASRQMSEGTTLRDWVVPMVQDTPRLNKPPLIYWLQALSARVLGDKPPGPPPEGYVRRLQAGLETPPTGSIGVYRAPSAICAALAALLTWRIGRRLFDPRAALLGGALLASCVMVVWDAHQARADQLLLLTTAATQFALWRLWRSRSARPSLGACAIFWVCLALGIMSKGPVTPMITLLTALAVSAATGEWRWLLRTRPLLGLLIVGAIVAPWVALVARSVGWGSYVSLIMDETVGRSLAPKESHWGPPGYHLVLLPLMFWPGSLATAIGVHRAFRLGWPSRGARLWKRRPGRDGELFCLAWAVPAWIVFECVSTKLPHYTMPLYPALALLSARAILAIGAPASAGRWIARQARSVPSRTGFAIWAALGLGICVAAPCVAARLGELDDSLSSRAQFIAAATAGLGLVSWSAALALARRSLRAQLVALLGACVAAWTVFMFTLPRLSNLWVSSRLVASVRALDPRSERPIATAGYNEDSLVFLTRGRVEKIKPADAPAWLASHPEGLLIVRTGADLAALRARPAGSIRGFNYATGDWAHLLLVERLPSSR